DRQGEAPDRLRSEDRPPPDHRGRRRGPEGPRRAALGMRRAGVLAAAALALGMGLRIWGAFSSGLWLDELHTLAHASPPDVAGVLEHTHWDFHAPLFFVAVHALKPFLKCPEMLRFIPIGFSL